MQHIEDIHAALQDFAEAVTLKMSQAAAGEPEEQLRGPFENLIQAVGEATAQDVVPKGESSLPGRTGKPDFAVTVGGLLAGFVELKAPGKGANPERFSGHDRRQWERFQPIPNLIYSDGNEWALYRDGELAQRRLRFSGDVTTDGKAAVSNDDARGFWKLIVDFLSWKPIIPKDIAELVGMVATYCDMLRNDVREALNDEESPLVQLAGEWRDLLFPEASDDRFADAYAQTVTFALLLARSEGATTLDLSAAEQQLASEHALLSRALQVFTDPAARGEISVSLDLLQRVVDEIPPGTLTGAKDPWLHFYEDFLAEYDPSLRKDAGAYYTPVEVVHCQVRLVDELLSERLGRDLGFAHPSVLTLDPAAGTGTYLVAVIERAVKAVEDEQGKGAVPGRATQLALNLNGFEIMVGPYAVAQLRVSRALEDNGATLPKNGPHVYLTDTLEPPNASPPTSSLFHRPISDQHERALRVKWRAPVIVCLGNPPYDRHSRPEEAGKARAGGWVRWGDGDKDDPYGDGTGAILNDFLEPALQAGHGRHVKNLYNLYVYFWRWALWKVFEHETAQGPGVVSYISASSYLDGDAFAGMREYMRRVCDAIWIIDLGGEGRGTRQDDNVFNIQTPVAITVAARVGDPDEAHPAEVRYARIAGTRDDKLAALEEIKSFSDLDWNVCPHGWQAPFRPAGTGDYFNWPLLTDLFPWQQSGVKAGRTWVIAPDERTLKVRWQHLCKASDDRRRELFKDSPSGRKVHDTPYGMRAIVQLATDANPPKICHYAYRSFDRQYVFADRRLVDRPGPALWQAHAERQVYATTLLNHPLGTGPALVAAAYLPDLHHFRGSYGAKEVIPLYRDARATKPNITPKLLAVLEEALGIEVKPEDLLAYVYGMLAQPTFTERFEEQLETREVRVPVTKNAELFQQVVALGRKLLWLHTYGERYVPDGKKPGRVPRGKARCTDAVPSEPERYPEGYRYREDTRTLIVGEGKFAPVAPEVYEFEVSGLKVVQSWLAYRMKEGAGRKSSPLDAIRPEEWTPEFTTELLELLWVLEATLALYPQQQELLEQVLSSELLTEDELPDVPDKARKAPKVSRRPKPEKLIGDR
ncbi:MAG: type ISP restriction/modification enzyme [Planctomycetota bacterium]